MLKVKNIFFIILLALGGYLGFKTYVHFFDVKKPTISLNGIEDKNYYCDNLQCVIASNKKGKMSIWLDKKPLMKNFKLNVAHQEYPFTIPTRTLSNGKHNLKIEITDNTYNENKSTQELAFYVDNVPLQAAFIKPEDLEGTPKGLGGYFERWWEEQDKLWGKDFPLKEQTCNAVFSVLACALGPIYQDDILSIIPDDIRLNTFTLKDSMNDLKRFVIGDGRDKGYVFSHPRLGQYFYDSFSLRERRSWDRKFVDYGEWVLTELNNGYMRPKDVPKLSEEAASELEKILGLDKSQRKASRKGRTRRDSERLDKVERAVDLLDKSLSDVISTIKRP